MKHCELFQKHAAELNKNLNVFVQVNTSNEPQKGGIEASDLSALVKFILQECKNLKFKGERRSFCCPLTLACQHIAGLMTIGSLTESKNEKENADFERLHSLRADICKQFELDEKIIGKKRTLQLRFV